MKLKPNVEHSIFVQAKTVLLILSIHQKLDISSNTVENKTILKKYEKLNQEWQENV